MMKLITIIKKNLKLILRTKSSALIVIFGPLMLILLISMAFNTAAVQGVRIATYSEEYSALSESLLEDIQRQGIKVQRAASQEECVEMVRRSAVTLCIFFPEGLSAASEETILFTVDQTRMNIAYFVLDAISQKVATKSKEISAQLTKAIVDTLKSTDQKLQDRVQFLEAISGTTETGQQQLDDVSSKISQIDTSPKTSSYINKLQQEINQLQQQNISLVGIPSLVEGLEKDLTAINQQLERSNNLKQEALQRVDAVKITIANNLNYLSSLQNTFSQVHEDVESVKTTSLGQLVSPITTKIEPVAAQQTHLSTLFPALVILVVMFAALMLAATLEIRERNSSAYFKNFITPTSDLIFLIGDFLTNMILVVVQLLVLFAVAYFFFKETILNNAVSLVVTLILVSTTFILVGMFIGTLFKSEETAVLAALSIGFLMLFFSSTILPVEVVLPSFEKFISYNPFVIGEQLLGKALLFSMQLYEIRIPIFYLVGYSFGFLALTFATKKIFKRSA